MDTESIRVPFLAMFLASLASLRFNNDGLPATELTTENEGPVDQVRSVVSRLTAKREARMAGAQAPMTAGRTSASPSLPKNATET